MLKQLLAEIWLKDKVKCFKCGKDSHFLRYCKTSRRIMRSTSLKENSTQQSSQHHHSYNSDINHDRMRPFNLECKRCTEDATKGVIVDVRRLQIEDNDDWSTAHKSDPILSKFMSNIESKRKKAYSQRDSS